MLTYFGIKKTHTGKKSQSNGLTDNRKIHLVGEKLLKNNAHLNMKKGISTNNSSNLIHYIDCGENE